MNPYCNAHGIGLIPWSPQHGGDLTHPIDAQTARRATSNNVFSEADKTIIAHVEEVAQKRGWTMSQVALAWIDKKVSSPIVGISSVCHRPLYIIWSGLEAD